MYITYNPKKMSIFSYVKHLQYDIIYFVECCESAEQIINIIYVELTEIMY